MFSMIDHQNRLAPPNIAPENIIIHRPIRASATGAILGGAKSSLSPGNINPYPVYLRGILTLTQSISGEYYMGCIYIMFGKLGKG